MKQVLPINRRETKKWILEKHYAKRMPPISFSYGLYLDGVLEGIVCYGISASKDLCMGICGEDYSQEVIELNRLAINSNSPKNSASFLVANSMKMLPHPYKIVVSYADTSMNHIGYIYQATNFIYTGLSIKMKDWILVDGNKHSKTLCEQYSLEERKNSDKFKQVERPRKHRYIRFIGTKKEKEERLSELKYKILPYPKGESKKYLSPDVSDRQKTLNI